MFRELCYPAGRLSIARSKVRSFDLATRSIMPLIRQIAFSVGMHSCETSAQYLRQVVPSIFRGRGTLVIPRGDGVPGERRRENTTTLKPPDFLVKTALKGGSRWH